MSQIIPLIDQVDSLVTHAGTAADIKPVLETLRVHCETLERNHAALNEMFASLREEITAQQADHAKHVAKLQKLQGEEIARLMADKTEYEQGLRDLGERRD